MVKNTETPEELVSLRSLASTLTTLADDGCSLCPLHLETSRVCIPVNLPTRKVSISGTSIRPLLIGEAPGYSEEETGKLFSGSAGKLLDSMLEEVGLNREWFFTTNAVKCRPEDNRAPTAKEIKTCTTAYLSQELQAIKPQYGLALGNGGCQAILGKKGITKLNGTIEERHGVKWVFGFHPAAVLRNPRYKEPLRQALLVFSRMLKNEEGIPETQTTLVNTKELLKELIAEFEKKPKAVTIDTETWSKHPGVGRFPGGGLAWWDPSWKLVTMQFTFRPGYSYTVPLWHDKTPWKDPAKVLRILKPHMEKVKTWYMQNGKYDSKVMEKVGTHIRHSWDPMAITYATDENNLKGLGFLAMVHLGVADYKDMVDKSNMFFEPLDLVSEYGGMDTDYTHRLVPVTRRILKEDFQSYRLYRKLLHPWDLVLTDVEYRGMPLDVDKLEERTVECEGYIAKAKQAIFDTVGMEFNPNSTAQLGNVLFDRMGLPVIQRTPTGNPSTAESVLLRLRTLDDTGIMDQILEYRKWQGYMSRYLKPWPILMDEGGRLHPHFKPFHTITGRLSCENPNMQQVPRDTFIRGIIGGRPGWQLVEADYSQAEMRLAAHYSQDPALLRIYNSGRDVHMEMAMQITGLSADEVSSEQRKQAKAVNFGFLYGMGWKNFVDYAKDNYGLDVTEYEAQQARKDYFNQFRKLTEWHARQRKKAQANGFVTSAIGRKRRLHDIRSTNEGIRAEAERQAINSPVQSLASDMMGLAMIQLEERLPASEAILISTVHDSILFEIREDKLDKWVPVITETMENLPLEKDFDCILTVPIVADVKYGTHWSEGAKEFV